MVQQKTIKEKPKSSGVFKLLKPYLPHTILLSLLAIVASLMSLLIPKLISKSIDSFEAGNFVMKNLIYEFGGIAVLIFILTYLQSIAQVYISEKVAKNVRNSLAEKISNQSYEFIEKTTPSKILTNMTSDIDSIKMLIGMAMPTIISSLVTVIGAAIILLTINWKLALTILSIIPIIGILFSVIFKNAHNLMIKSREVIDVLNKVINESVLGSALIRVLNSQVEEQKKFVNANIEAKNIGIQILKIFATLIPLITFIANLAMLAILMLGGHFIINGSMTLGDFAAFNSYVALLIFPVLVLGMMTNLISQAEASYGRIKIILDKEVEKIGGNLKKEIIGEIEFKNVSIKYDDKYILKDVSFDIKPNTRTAILGPTGAGKSQILHLIIGLVRSASGEIIIDSENINNYDNENLHKQITFVFQDSVMFNLSLKENIAFGGNVSDEDMEKAIKTSELDEFINTLPDGLNTIISERGTSLSGGQKQRIMLARALVLNPKVLLLDDFTARIDNKTEEKIIKNLNNNYKDLTLVSVTQKIGAIKNYDKIIVIMDGEIIATGKHDELMTTSTEYVQIYNSQKSTNNYE